MYEGPPRLSVIRTRVTSIDLAPATTRSADAVASAARTSSTNISNREAVRDHDRLGRAVAGGGEHSSARRRSGRGPWRRWQSEASAESVSPSMPEYTQTRVRVVAARKARRTRVWWW